MALSVTPRRISLLLVILFLAIVAGAWLERKAIARRFADAEFAARKVDAKYEIRSIGPRTQRIEHLVIGNPARPDLTADWAEVELGVGLSGVSVRSLRAGGVRLHGSYANGKLSFGMVDRLLPPPSDKPFSLPDMVVAVSDARAAIATDQGVVSARIDGKGNLASGFAGVLLATLPELRLQEASGAGLSARLALSTERRRILFSGPVVAQKLDISGNVFRDAGLRVKGEASESFDEADADWSLVSAVETLIYGQARRLHADGRFVRRGGDQRLTANARLEGVAPSARDQQQLAGLVPTGMGTPAEPLMRQLRAAIAALGKGGEASIALEYRQTGKEASLLAAPPTYVAQSGARLVGTGRGLVYPLGGGAPAFDGEFALSGGGFPVGTVRLALADREWAGTARFQPYRAGGAQLALAPVNLLYSGRGLTLDTVALIDGPLGSGRITGLRVPVALHPGRSALQGCLKPSFQSLQLGSLKLSPTILDMCLSGKEARLNAPKLVGRLGGSPLLLTAGSGRVGFSHGDFSLGGVGVRLGAPGSQSQLDARSLSGAFGESGVATGRFDGAAGYIGNVPLRMSEGEGQWRYDRGVVTVNGGLRVADSAADPRFNPLVSNDFVLRLANNHVTANGIAREPKSGARVADVHIVHDLGSGTGNAVLDVAGLTFGQQLQPEMLTSTTLGVVANVVGTIDGQGTINWTPKGVTSSGRFGTKSLDFAAAFGPVTGMYGEIALSDLLGLETGPGQTVRIAAINPGIAVLNGEVVYRLLPGQRVAVEGGRWPFAGGLLILEPTVLDLSQTLERRLTFRVEGLDAAQFINQLQFENIAATGIFDGTLPMIFDEHGGRIEGGRLVARGGGTLAYVGEISNQNLGMMGRVAFDALKAMKYNRLSIDLAGPLDGDVVTKISFAGVSQAPIDGVRASLPIPVKITGLDNFPFIFNVTIVAPFRKLFDMSRTLADPSLLIERLNPNLERVGPAKSIQPSESEPVGKER